MDKHESPEPPKDPGTLKEYSRQYEGRHRKPTPAAQTRREMDKNK